MAENTLRTLFCFGNNQNFFDLPIDEIRPVWEATQQMLSAIDGMNGVNVIGTFDDDAHMVGPSFGWPWTFYVLADVADQPTAREVCDLLRNIRVGDHALWRYFKVEARMGRELTIRNEVSA